jgi:ribonuclease HI
LPAFQHRIVKESEQIATDLDVWKAFRSKRRLEIITDGGLKDHNATFGWKIILPDRTVLFQGAGPADGPIETESSTRSELFGFAAPMLIIDQLSKWWGITHRCKFRWLVDSQAAIKQVKDIRRKATLPRYQPDNVDILTTLFHAIKDCRRPITIDWIKGHQDDDAPYDELSRDAQLNIEADQLATDYYREIGGKSRSKLQHFDPTQVSVSINRNRLPGKIEASIRFHVNGTVLKEYIGKRNKWNAETASWIDWYTFGLNFRTLTPKAKLQHMKLVHDIQPLGWKSIKSRNPKIRSSPCVHVAKLK